MGKKKSFFDKDEGNTRDFHRARKCSQMIKKAKFGRRTSHMNEYGDCMHIYKIAS